MIHISGVRPAPKMDTPTGLFRGTCSCSWASDGVDNERRARKAARAHADAKNAIGLGRYPEDVRLMGPSGDMIRLIEDFLMGPIYPWDTQANQYPPVGTPGVTYFAGKLPNNPVPIDCLLYYSPEGELRGIANHYAVDYPPMEVAGDFLVLVHPKYQNRGVGTALLDELVRRYDVSFTQQKYSRKGLALIAHYLITHRNYNIVVENT